MIDISKYLKSLLFSISLGFGIIIIITLSFGFSSIKETFFDFSWRYALLALGAVFAKWIFETFSLIFAMRRTKKISFANSFNTTMIFQLFSLLTPFFSGGQPFAMYYLHTKGIDYGESGAGLFYRSMIFQLILSVLGILGIIFLRKILSWPVLFAALTGVFINISVFFSVLFIGKNSVLSKKITTCILKILYKIRVIKDLEKTSKVVIEKVEQFNHYFSKHNQGFSTSLWILFFCFLQSVVVVFVGMFVLNGIGVKSSFELFFRTQLMSSSSNIMPTPGTSGGAEGLYLLFMNNVTSSEKIAGSMLIWRFLTYYFAVGFTGIFAILLFSKKALKSIIERK